MSIFFMRLRRRYLFSLLLLFGLALFATVIFLRNYPAAVRTAEFRVVPENEWPELFADETDFNSQPLRLALARNLTYLGRLPEEKMFAYGSEAVRASKVFRVQSELLAFLEQNPELLELKQFLKKKFKLLESVSSSLLPWLRDEEPVLFTGYYVPTLHGSLKPDVRYRYPLYKKPGDLVSINLRKFNLKRQVQKLWPWLEGLPFGPRLDELKFPTVRGRLQKSGKIVPYYSRTEIDYEDKLKGQNLELLWVENDIDRFFLQIQGSGRVLLENGHTVMVGYSAANGKSYRSIGGWLIRQGLMTRAAVSMPAIRSWLETHPERREEVFKVNPSYVFFRKLKNLAALGCYQVPVTANHSIATDRKVFPGGALALVATEKPTFSPAGKLVAWRKYQQLVFNQDTGGAIKGPFRVDLYCGDDQAAEQMAGVMKQHGRLFIFVPK